ncbi:NACHT domain-containing protein [Streptomyces inhibens]|uniref:NACHT domain-containing protein n=1 Tax=Streptomyces inhibens TaxID=2293571 RepID=UPI00402AFCBB
MRTGWLLHRGATRTKRWWNPFWTTLGITVLCLLALVLFVWGGRGLLVALFHRGTKDYPGWWWGPFNPDKGCSNVSSSCGAVNGVVMPLLLLAASTLLFLAWRLRAIHRFCTRRSRRELSRFVAMTGSSTDELAGRDELCNVIMARLHDRTHRRAQVIVGRAGVGKTALLVRLAERLAGTGAVPVAVNLRAAQEGLNFSHLARQSFEEIVQPKLRSEAELDRIWRWLRQRADRIVILADGLEDALRSENVRSRRDSMIREAIRVAGEERLPLVITARPHTPLRSAQCTITELQPLRLSPDMTLHSLIRISSWRTDPRLLQRVVDIADSVGSLQYLPIVQDLFSHDLLEPLLWESPDSSSGSDDGWGLWENFLRAWTRALIEGVFHPELPVDQDSRRAVVENLSALACVGLASGRTEVFLRELDPLAGLGQGAASEAGEDAVPTNAEWNHRVAAALDERMNLLKEDIAGPRIDVRSAATWGTRMGLIDEHGESVRFHRSAMQAYLGSRYLARVLDNSCGGVLPISRGLRLGGPDLLMALTLHSRSHEGRCTCRQGHQAAGCPVLTLREMLLDAAEAALAEAEHSEQVSGWPAVGHVGARQAKSEGSLRVRALELYRTAVEIDTADANPDPQHVIGAARRNWGRIGRGEEPDELRAAKLALVRQCGAAAGRLTTASDRGAPAYDSLFGIGRHEADHRVRTAIAEQVGAGGERAFQALYRDLAKPARIISTVRPQQPENDKAGAEPPLSANDTERQRERRRGRNEAERGSREERRQARNEALREVEMWRSNSMGAWVLPMLIQSNGVTHLGSPRQALEEWVSFAGTEDTARRRGVMPGYRSALDVSLAQGFKYAANQKPNADTNRHARDFLRKQAEEMLKHSTFWYTRLTLLHALTLWELPDDVAEPQSIDRPSSDPRGQVDHWLALGRHQQEHPLVRAAADLAVRALRTLRPARFLWIDDVGVAAEIGTVMGRPLEQRAHNLWIPPSIGWTTLDTDAQQLLADVLLLMMLSERGYRPKDLFRALAHSAADPLLRLPACLSENRRRLDVLRAVGFAQQPGSNCSDECSLMMCPYPAKVENLRLEFSEAFCLHQRDLLKTWQPRAWLHMRFRRQAWWQHEIPISKMRQFWEDLCYRARDVTQEDHTNPSGRRQLRRH